jgi:nucleoside-diphosphate-sugar epimerase
MAESNKQSGTVLVTGGSGFIGAHCILQLIQAGYAVQTTVRSLKREAEVRSMLKTGGVEAGEALSFFAADLSADAGWQEAVTGCDCVLHVASPFPTDAPKDEDELIRPAREGTLRVLRAARQAGVKRVVLTSSFAAVAYGHKPTDRTYTEQDWSDVNGDIRPYPKSKTLAERAAWDFIAREGGALELSVVNPAAVFGPVLGPDYSSSVQLLQRLLNGSVPGVPNMSYHVVDVRDVADLHLRAMTNPAAKGERFLALTGDSMTIEEMAQVLRKNLGEAAKHVPTRRLPDWLLRLIGMVNPAIREMVPNLGKVRKASNEKARRLLGWSPHSNEEAIVATGESLLRLGLLSK